MIFRLFSKLLQRPSPVDFLGKKPVILDVRSGSEYKAGHISGSRHVPLDQLGKRLGEVKKWNRPVLTCCASGRRSGIAAGMLRNAGVEVMNGGGWRQLDRIIQQQNSQ